MRRPVVLAIWLIPFVLAALHALTYGDRLIDDAFITFTYAKNLTHGVGAVFSGGQRVEATSSMLWALVLSPFESLGIGAPVGSKLLGLLAFLACVFLSARLTSLIAREVAVREDTSRYAYLTATLVALASPLALWSYYGMENGLVALLLLASTYAFLLEVGGRGGFLSAVPVALLEAARPEGFVFVAIFVLARIAAYSRGHQSRGWLVGWLAIALVPVLAYEIWGRVHFGHWLPNTVAAKITGSAWIRVLVGLRYLTLPASRVWMAGLVMAMAVIADGISRDHSRLTSRLASWGPVLLVLTICLAQLGLTVASGGDWMPDARFISHVTPLIAVLMVTSIPYLRQLLAEWPKRMVRVLAMGAVVYFVASNVTSTRDARKYVEMLAASEQRALYGMADYLNHHATADDAVACSDVGRVSYYFHGRVIDWWGLADEEIARTHQSIGHLRPETILSRRPRFIVLYSTRPTLDATSMESNMAVYSRPFWASPEFHRSYRHVLSLFFWPDRYHVLFERAEPRSD